MWLSLAARGGALKIGSLANMKSSPGGGAIAVRTASSNRSNSTSLITRALPGLREAPSQIWFVAGLPGSFKLYRSGFRGSLGY
jgi:hypothetical protein